MKKIPLSLTVITLNEEKNIERCLQSVPFASEYLVVDSQSQDRTVEVAKSFGAKVLQKEWLGFGPQKQFAVDSAANEWVICLDADEALSPEAQAEILQLFESNSLDPECGYTFPRLSKHLGKWIRHGGWYPDYQLRMFHRKHSAWLPYQIHEHVKAPKEYKMKAPILHHVFANLAAQVQTNNRYSTLQAQDHFREGKKFSWWRLLGKPLTKFVECYFLKLGFLDGFAGFVIAIGAAHSVFMRWVKVWELEKSSQRP